LKTKFIFRWVKIQVIQPSILLQILVVKVLREQQRDTISETVSGYDTQGKIGEGNFSFP